MLVMHPVRSRSDYKRFIQVPFTLYPAGSHWVPPIKSGEMDVFHPKKNPAYAFSEVALWIAVKDGNDVGRIAAIINRRFQEKWDNNLGRFGYVNFIDDAEVSSALFDTAETWLRERGCDGVLGPMGFTDIDEQGLLIEGHDEQGTLPVIYCHPYYQEHIEARGYRKRVDWLEFRLDVPAALPKKLIRVERLVQDMIPEVRLFRAVKRTDFRPFVDDVFDLLNIAYEKLFGTTEFTPEQVRYYTKMYFSYLHPEYTKLVLDSSDRVVALLIAMPSLTQALQKIRGSLFPFGFLRVLSAMKKPREVDIYLAAVHPDYDNSGIAALVVTDFVRSLIANGVSHVETSAVLETNDRVLSFWKEFDHRQHKRRRAYTKDL